MLYKHSFSSDSSPVVSKLSLLIIIIYQGSTWVTRAGNDGKAREGETPLSPLYSVIPLVKEPVLVFHATY